jgi:Lipocalin-like domain
VPVIIGGTRRTAVDKSVGKLAISAPDRGRSERLLGSWRLVSFEQVLASGEVLKPFGDSPSRLILYDADRRMSVAVAQNGNNTVLWAKTAGVKIGFGPRELP